MVVQDQWQVAGELGRALGRWDESAVFQPVIRQSQALDPRFAVARRTALADLAATLGPDRLDRRDELLDTLCAFWCTTLGVAQDTVTRDR